MKLYETFGTSGFHSTIVTTFGIDFEAFENIALSRLRNSGCRNTILVADRIMLDQALSGASSLPEAAGRLYSVVGAKARGVFHSKLVLQLGRKKARLLIGSANTTSSGMSGNLELVGLVKCGPEDVIEAQIVRHAWEHIEAAIGEDNHAVLQQLQWAQARASWLFQMGSVFETENPPDNADIDFLSSHHPENIMDRFVRHVGADSVSKLVVMSPYWDFDLRSLSELVDRLRPDETILLIDPSKALFPGHALNGISNLRLVDIGPFAAERFVHAKLFVAHTSSVDHVLYGSANCTAAALGHEGKSGVNDESCLYRRLPHGELADHLKLKEFLRNQHQVDFVDLPEHLPHESLLDDVQSNPHPGRFELVFDKLVWHPLPSAQVDGVTLELLDVLGNRLDGAVARIVSSSEQPIQYELWDFSQRPSLARLIFPDGAVSAPGIILSIADLREEARETSGKKSKYDPQLLTGEAEEGLWLLSALSDLEQLETQQKQDLEKIRRIAGGGGKTANTTTASFNKLGYADFIKGRKLKPAKLDSGRNTLAGSEASLVRDYLNRLLAVGVSLSDEDSESEVEMDALFDQGDSVADPEASIEGGEDFSDPIKDPLERRLKTDPDTQEQKWFTQRRTTRSQIEHAVEDFQSIMRNRAASNDLGSIDLLRLRALLTVLAASGYAGSYLGEKHSDVTSLQVLPVNNVEDDWPHLVGRVLFVLFAGKRPLISQLKIEDIYDQVPDDIFECWLMCIWIACACLSVDLHSEKIRFSLERILPRIYAISGLTESELISDSSELFLMSLSERFAQRLGIDGDKLMLIHEANVGQHFKQIIG